MNKAVVIAGGVGLLTGLAIGGTVGFIVARDQAEKELDALVAEQAESIKATFKQFEEEQIAYLQSQLGLSSEETSKEVTVVQEEPADWEPEHFKGYIETVEESGYSKIDSFGISRPQREKVKPKKELTNEEKFFQERNELEEHPEVFEEYKAEEVKKLSKPNKQKPYLISIEEFMQDRPDHRKDTLEYYEEDDVLVDERDQMITDIDGTIGAASLDHFGYRSDSSETLYVRNERLSSDYEVCRNKGSYAHMVLDLPIDLDTLPKRRGGKRVLED